MLLSRETVRFVLYFFRGYPGRTALMIALLVISSVAEGVGLVTLLPLLEFATGQGLDNSSDLTRWVIEGIRGMGVEPSLALLLGLIVVAMSLKAFFLWLAMKQVGYTIAQVATDLRLRLIRALLRARWSYFVRQPAGHFSNALSSEAERASLAYKEACASLAGIVQVAIYLAVVVLVSWQVAVIAAVVGPLMLFALRGFVRMGRNAGNRQTHLMRDLVGRVTELLPGIKAVKAMARERHFLPFLEEEADAFNDARRRSVLAGQSLRAFREPMIVLVLAVGLYGAVELGSAAPSAVLVAAVLFYRVMTTIGNLQVQYQAVTIHESAFWSLLEKVKEAEAQQEPGGHGRPPPPDLEEGLRLRNVSFGYDREAVLEEVDLFLPARSLTLFVGPSGAGKTTLADLLVGLLHPDHGTVEIDGVPLQETDVDAWRAKVGYVPQEMLLFHDTIRENVTLGSRGFGRNDVESALKAAGAWEFVSRLPDGMDQVVGERGATLSGGQRQRIAIARALLGRPRLLILDEATTALDPGTEARICETLLELRGRTTIVAISHQEALRAAADRIYVVSGGRVRRLETEDPADAALSAP